MGTNVQYNSVTLRNVQTLRFAESVEYDPSNTDVLFHKFRVRVLGSVHTGFLLHHGVDVDQNVETIPADLERRLRSLLMHPRGNYVYSLDTGEVLLQAQGTGAAGPQQDVNNGPKPIACDITHVVGKRVFRVEFEIEIALVECGGGHQLSNTYGGIDHEVVLNNRWSVTDEKDANFFTTRTIEGHLRVRHITAWPHLLRHLTVPPLQRGYRRDLMRFVDSPDGLSLNYLIVDRQRYASPPSPATDWEAHYTEVAAPGGSFGFGEMQITMIGGPSSPQFALLEAAVEVVYQRLGDLAKAYEDPGEGQHPVFLEHMAITEHLHANRIDLSIRVRHTQNEPTFLNARVFQMGSELEIDGYDRQQWPVPKLYDGSSPSGIFAKYWQSPCVATHGITSVVQGQPDEDEAGQDDTDQGEAEFFQAPEALQPDSQDGISQVQRQGGFPYVYYGIDITYGTGYGLAVLPIARWNPSGSEDTVRMIPLHGGVCYRTLTVQAERVGDWPQIPAYEDETEDANGIAMRLVSSKLAPEAPELTADGKTRLFKVQAKYVHAMSRPPANDELFAAGADPREQASPENTHFDGSRYLDLNGGIA